jgi:hypothetical protein
MAQFRGGQAGYGIGTQAPFGGSSENKTDSNPLDAIREQTSKIEDMLDTLSEPIKPWVLAGYLSLRLALLTFRQIPACDRTLPNRGDLPRGCFANNDTME